MQLVNTGANVTSMCLVTPVKIRRMHVFGIMHTVMHRVGRAHFLLHFLGLFLASTQRRRPATILYGRVAKRLVERSRSSIREAGVPLVAFLVEWMTSTTQLMHFYSSYICQQPQESCAPWVLVSHTFARLSVSLWAKQSQRKRVVTRPFDNLAHTGPSSSSRFILYASLNFTDKL